MGNLITVTREARGRVGGDGVELAYGYWPGRGAGIVALHGLTASFVNFVGIAEKLAGRHAVFGVDLRGRGDSDKPEGPYGFAQHGRDVAAAMRAMGLGPSVVVGHSMGAFVAAALAAQNPELVSGVVLIDGGYMPAMTAAPLPQPGVDPMLALRITQLRETYPSREAYRDFWKGQPHFPREDWGPWVEAFLDYELGGEAPRLQPKASEAAVRADLGEAIKRDEIVGRLQSIRVPMLMIRADNGFAPGQPPLYPEAMMKEFRSCVPGMEVATLANTTHYTMVLGDRGATAVADMICNFADR
jgi:pimeloyl-ACP methyl ester carboxylesterase